MYVLKAWLHYEHRWQALQQVSDLPNTTSLQIRISSRLNYHVVPLLG